MPKPRGLTTFAITQYLDEPAGEEYWQWEDDEKQHLQGDAQEIGAHVLLRLQECGMDVTALYAIVHDRDERTIWDEVAMGWTTQPKPRHVHVVGKLGDGEPLEAIAAAVGVQPQYVEKPGRGRFAYDNMLSYLTHAKYEEKFQYSPGDVATLAGPDYLTYDAQNRHRWVTSGRAGVKKKKAAQEVDGLIEQVLTGQVIRAQLHLDDELYAIYSRHSRRFDEALAIYGQRRAYKAAAALERGEFSTTVLFIHGVSGSGKTALVEQLCRTLAERVGWSTLWCATSNPLDQYDGEEILRLDDLRPGAMKAEEWLNLLDPRSAAPAAARYRNKDKVAPRLVVMTAPMTPEAFFGEMRSDPRTTEALDQFIRRLSAVVQVRVVSDTERMITVSPVRRLAAPRRLAIGWQRETSLHFGAEDVPVVEVPVEYVDGATPQQVGELLEGPIDRVMALMHGQHPDLPSPEVSWSEYEYDGLARQGELAQIETLEEQLARETEVCCEEEAHMRLSLAERNVLHAGGRSWGDPPAEFISFSD